jgi:hypothetical protein
MTKFGRQEQIAADVIEPDALIEIFQLQKRVLCNAHFALLQLPIGALLRAGILDRICSLFVILSASEGSTRSDSRVATLFKRVLAVPWGVSLASRKRPLAADLNPS